MIEHEFSYGREKDLLEIQGLMTEQEMDEEAKVYGVAHTDTALVNFTVQSSVDLLLKNGFRLGDINALDPFTGDGVFIDSLLKHGVKKVSAYEIRGWQCQQTRERYGDKADIRCADAFKMKPRNFNLIIGNPPYGKVAKNAEIDTRIQETYGGGAVNQTALYDAYVRSIRWASDNLKNGMIAYIVNSGFLDGIAFSNFRKSVEKEFSKVYVLNLRGNHRTSGEACRKEGGNVFGQECRTGIAILFLLRSD